MKKNDFATILLIASVSAMLAWFAASTLIGEPKKSATKYQAADPISSDIIDPESSVFNKQAINPTVDRSIGQSSNQLPFGSGE
jgi:hypothetical protein